MVWVRALGMGLLLGVVLAAPAVHKRVQEKPAENQVDEEVEFSPENDLPYSRYLKEVVSELEKDPEFKKKLEASSADEIKSGKIAEELESLHPDIRNRLDEIKRREYERLNELQGRAQQRPLHLNMHKSRFEQTDLRKLIQKTVADLDAIDVARRKKFKEYEMNKEFELKRKMAEMTPEDRAKATAEHEAEMAKHKQHPKLHEPGHKAQLEEVWEEEDHMKGEEFDPKAFFALHDTNDDHMWDPEEVEALFLHEVNKMYNASLHEDDMREREEEMERMREQVYGEMDANRDRFISLDEFLAFTHKKAFEEDEGYQGLDEQQLYDEEEYKRFQEERLQQLRAQGIVVPDLAMPLPDHQYQAVHPSQLHPEQAYQVPQMHPQQAYQMPQMHPNQMPQMHPNQMPQVHQNQVPQMHPNQQMMHQQVYQNQVPQMDHNQVLQMQGGQLNQQFDQQANLQYQQAPVQTQQGSAQYRQVPVQNQQVPMQNQQVPMQNQQVPVQNQQVPVQNQQVPVQNQQVPVQNQQVPVQNQQVPVQNQQVPVQNQQVPVQNQVPPQNIQVPGQSQQAPVQHH